MRGVARTVTSLDKPVGDDEQTPFGALLHSNDAQPDEEVHVSLREEVVRNAMSTLPDAQRTVLELRFGMSGAEEPRTIDEVVRQLGMSRNRVRRLEADGPRPPRPHARDPLAAGNGLAAALASTPLYRERS